VGVGAGVGVGGGGGGVGVGVGVGIGGVGNGEGGGGSSAPVIPVTLGIEKPITEKPPEVKTIAVEEKPGTVTLELIAPDKIESGELYNVAVKLLSPVQTSYVLSIEGINQVVALEANEEKSVTVTLRAPEAKGSYTITASIGGTVKSKDVSLDYKPLFLYVNETKTEGGTLIDVTVKNYEQMSTELRIIKDSRSDVFLELIEGQKEYSRQLKLAQLGEYKIIAKASFQGAVVDTDEYLLAVEGTDEEKANYMLILLAFVAAMIMLGYLYYHGRHKKEIL